MSMQFPALRKARQIKGKNLVFHDATIGDAGFIHWLRTDAQKSRHLSKTPPDLEAQIRWLRNYAQVQDQAYFVINDISREPIGTVRLYDQREDSFCWGSWILKDGAPQIAAIESALIVYAYAIDHLGFKRAHFDVRKENERVWRFHERFGASRVAESDIDYFYEIDFDKIKAARERYKRYLPGPIEVEF